MFLFGHKKLFLVHALPLSTQYHCGDAKYHPSLITLEELWLQQEIEGAYDIKVACNDRPTWDAKNRTASTDLIKNHFWHIRGINGAPCTYLMRKNAQVSPQSASLDSTSVAESFDNHMIKIYLIIKRTELLGNIKPTDGEPPLNMYTFETMEDNACCFPESKRIVQGVEAKVYMNEFNIHSEIQLTWRKLNDTFLGAGLKDMFAA